MTNFSVFSNHVAIEPPLQALINGGDTNVDGFIAPGHVATIVGTKAFDFLPTQHNKPTVIAGFEPLDILQAVDMLLTQFLARDLYGKPARVENQYARVVSEQGNAVALKLMSRVFEVRKTFEWRGLGWIPESGLAIAEEYSQWDAEKRFTIPGNRVPDPAACECGSVLTGKIKPWQCRVFGTACTPATPIGTCMVSPEGACAAYYNFGRINREAAAAAAGAL